MEKTDKMRNENINIAFCFDRNYIYQAKVAISSLLDHARSYITYHFRMVVDASIPDTYLEELRDFILRRSSGSDMTFYPQDNVFSRAYETRGITRAAYYRLMLHRILPDVDYTIYSDVDVLLKSNLRELLNVPIKKYAVAAVKDIVVNQQANWDRLASKYTYWKPLLTNMYREYCNSGFLYMNLAMIREKNWDNIVVEYSKMPLNFQDQDILNILFSQNKELIYHLPPKYVCMPKHIEYGNYDSALVEGIINVKEFRDVLLSPAIFHYPGAAKPWSNPENRYNKKWCEYVKRRRELLMHFDALSMRSSYGRKLSGM